MTTLLCRVTGPLGSVREVLAASGAEIPCRPVALRAAAGVAVQVLVESEDLDRARGGRADVAITVLRDVTAAAIAARSDLSPGGRFAGGAEIPRGIGRKE